MSYQLGAEQGQHAELYGEPRNEEPRPRFRGSVATVIALLGIGVFAGGLWFAYQQGVRHAASGNSAADVPLIHADERPTKVKPENPGGMGVPDRDKLIYTQKRAAMEHLLPPAEKPMARPTASAPAPANALEAPPQAAVSAALQQAPAQQTAAKAGVKPISTSATPAKPTPAHEPSASGRGTRIQLGSVRSPEVAREEWDRIKHANADLLASISAAPVRADLGDKGVYYRIQTAPIADADRICGELKRRNVGCIIAR